MSTKYPRVRDLPEAARLPFEYWLRGQTRPLIPDEGMADSEQDAYFQGDYERWKEGKPVIDWMKTELIEHHWWKARHHFLLATDWPENSPNRSSHASQSEFHGRAVAWLESLPAPEREPNPFAGRPESKQPVGITPKP
jgi:hypothetical protein